MHCEIVYHNELKAKVIASFDMKHMIGEQMSYYPEGYKHMPLYKSGAWDGKIRMFDKRSGLFYKHHLPDVVNIIKSEGGEYSIKDPKSFMPKFKTDLDSFFAGIEGLANLTPTDFQETIVRRVLTQNQGLVLSPTSSGKSFITYMLVRAILSERPNDRILISTQSLMLVEQLLNDFDDYAAGLGWNPRDHIQLMGGGRTTQVDQNKSIVISTWQTLHKQAPEFFHSFNHFICDEAHQATGKSIKGILENMSHAQIRVGLTGTLNGTKMHELEMRGLFGPTIKVVTTRDLMDRGFVADLEIKCLSLQYPQETCKIVQGLKTYQKEVDYVVGNEWRNQMILKKAFEFEGNTLILCNYVKKHAHVLRDMAETMAVGTGKEVYYIAGDVDVEEKMLQKSNMETANNKVLIATYGTLSTGVSIKNIEQIIFAHPFKARIRNLQSIGRGLRMKEGKTKVRLIDICDDLRTVKKCGKISKVNHLYRHFVNRLEIYESEEFDYQIESVGL